jgi:protein-disulfide isomerase
MENETKENPTETVPTDNQSGGVLKRIPKEFYTPLAVILVGVMVSTSILYVGANGKGLNGATAGTLAQNGQGQTAENLAKTIAPLTNQDHIRGNVNAKVKIVEYSDLDCIFCKRLHDTLQEVTKTYGDKVAWVYRHLPLTSLHPQAAKKALAAECAAEQGGNDMFWRFADEAFANQDPSNYDNEINTIVAKLGLDKSKLDACVASNKYASKITAQSDNATQAGAGGTPFTVVTNGKTFTPIVGAVPIEQFKSAIDALLK